MTEQCKRILDTYRKNPNIKSVLILGNGVSRLRHKPFVQHWPGEIWGCNNVFKELITKDIPRLNVLTGDHDALKEASAAIDKYKFAYRIFSKRPQNIALPHVEKLDNIPAMYVRDSGSTLTVKALVEGYEKIYLAGFDLGGYDIYVDDLHTQNKTNWIQHWRKIAKSYGLDRIEFIGKDHKKYLLSDEPDNKYWQLYSQGINHLEVV